MEHSNYEVSIYDIRGEFITHIVRASKSESVASSIKNGQSLMGAEGGRILINYNNVVSIEILEVDGNEKG